MMNPSVSGNVYFEGSLNESRDLRRHLERRLEAWIQAKSRRRNTLKTRYNLEVAREGYRRHLCVCRVEVQLGKILWKGAGEGSDVHRALTQALSRMAAMQELRLVFPQNRNGVVAA